MWPVESLVSSNCILGEGPLWVVQTQSIFWVDIKAKLLFQLETSSDRLRQWQFDIPLTSIVEKQTGGFFGTSAQGFVEIDLEETQLTLVNVPKSEPVGNRFNDAKVDPFGHLWAGSMDDNEKKQSGYLYRMDANKICEPRDSGYCVTNGPAFSPDGKTLYHTDTFRRLIYQFDLSENGCLSNKRVFVKIPVTDGYPDGMTVDAEGCVWVCHFGGHKISRFSAQGNPLQEYQMPCANITSCTFGGKDLTELYVTSARWTLDEKQIMQQPMAGNLLKIKTDTQGIAPNQYAG